VPPVAQLLVTGPFGVAGGYLGNGMAVQRAGNKRFISSRLVTGTFGARLLNRANAENLQRPGNNEPWLRHCAEFIGVP
jgi:hypothetical protein